MPELMRTFLCDEKDAEYNCFFQTFPGKAVNTEEIYQEVILTLKHVQGFKRKSTIQPIDVFWTQKKKGSMANNKELRKCMCLVS